MTENRASTTARDRSLQLLEETATCTLATASVDGKPEAATVRFVTDDDLNVFVTTESVYRKYENMTRNPSVAIVVDGDEGNLQLEGQATETHGDAAESVISRYVEKYGTSEYLTNDQSVFFSIETHWVKLLVDGGFPPTYEMVLGDGETDPLGAV
jgi:uncharacterized pyridoxamine 5'-phosphate oxidase family protein